MKKYIPLALPVLVNIYPLVGIIFLGWNVNLTLLTYFVETLILIIFSTIKMIMSINVWDPESANMNPYWVTQSRSQVLSNFLLLMYVFMIVCSGAYLILWGRSITAFIATAGPAQYWPILSMAIFSLISHTFSFVYNFILGGERNTVAMSYIFRRTMVGRMLPLFLSTFISFFSVGITGSNSKSAMIPLVVIFGAVAFFDILAHFNEHKKS